MMPMTTDVATVRPACSAGSCKHARTSSCRVLIGYGHDELILEVTDNGAGLPGYGFQVSAHIPLPASSPPG